MHAYFAAFRLSFFSSLYAQESWVDACCSGCTSSFHAPPTRSANIPTAHVTDMSDEYLTGYVQSLIDMHYYEFSVQVIVHNGTLYAFNLPNVFLMRQSILCFIQDIPCIGCVQPVSGCPDEFICCLEEVDPDAALEIQQMDSFRSMTRLANCKCCRIKGVWLPQNTLLFQPLDCRSKAGNECRLVARRR